MTSGQLSADVDEANDAIPELPEACLALAWLCWLREANAYPRGAKDKSCSSWNPVGVRRDCT